MAAMRLFLVALLAGAYSADFSKAETENATEATPVPIRPVDCALVRCALPTCKPGFQVVTLPKDCCPSCQPLICPAIPCEPVRCKPGYHPADLPGQCCPTCVKGPDCRVVRCGLPICRSDQRLVKNLGECCYTCEDRCKNVTCPLIRCAAGHRPVLRPGSCCKTCARPKCLGVLCPVSKCRVGYRRVVRPGQCCATCERCPSRGLCPYILCPCGRRSVTLSGRCCPVCIKIPTSLCPRNEVYQRCGTVCQETCADLGLPRPCTKNCRRGCSCRPGYVRQRAGGHCVRRSSCAKTQRCSSNEVLLTRPPYCIAVCLGPRPVCNGKNLPGCYCKSGFVRLFGNGTGPCVPQGHVKCTFKG